MLGKLQHNMDAQRLLWLPKLLSQCPPRSLPLSPLPNPRAALPNVLRHLLMGHTRQPLPLMLQRPKHMVLNLLWHCLLRRAVPQMQMYHLRVMLRHSLLRRPLPMTLLPHLE